MYTRKNITECWLNNPVTTLLTWYNRICKITALYNHVSTYCIQFGVSTGCMLYQVWTWLLIYHHDGSNNVVQLWLNHVQACQQQCSSWPAQPYSSLSIYNHVQCGQLNHIQACQYLTMFKLASSTMFKPVNNNVQAGQLNHVQACQQQCSSWPAQPCSRLSTTMFKLANTTMFKPATRQKQVVRFYVSTFLSW